MGRGSSHEPLKGLGGRGVRQSYSSKKGKEDPAARLDMARFSDARKSLTLSRPLPVASLIQGAPH